MPPCAFCAIVVGDAPAHVVLDDDRHLAFLDVRPVFEGHVLLVPKVHHVTLTDLPPDDVGPLFQRVRLLASAVRDAMRAQGTFVAMNNVVSQSVPHLHVHVVPRTTGDGLRGFFWPRQRYDDDDAMATVAERIRSAVAEQDR